MCDKMAISVYILKIVENDPFSRLQMKAKEMFLKITKADFYRSPRLGSSKKIYIYYRIVRLILPFTSVNADVTAVICTLIHNGFLPVISMVRT